MYRMSHLSNRTGHHEANPSLTKPYSETYPRKGKTQQVEGLTTRPPLHHLKRLVLSILRETSIHKGYRYLPPRGTTIETQTQLCHHQGTPQPGTPQPASLRSPTTMTTVPTPWHTSMGKTTTNTCYNEPESTTPPHGT
ncbi:hypothetical protein Taro_051395, partial [Colocasia esculenta]|nr:hypothetical protein [Colocasia esculenta]